MRACVRACRWVCCPFVMAREGQRVRPLHCISRSLSAILLSLDPALFNKGTAFKTGERDRLRFRGLLPARIMNIHLQKERFLQTLRAEESTIKKNILLEDLHDRNETLYHRVLVDHVSCYASWLCDDIPFFLTC